MTRSARREAAVFLHCAALLNSRGSLQSSIPRSAPRAGKPHARSPIFLFRRFPVPGENNRKASKPVSFGLLEEVDSVSTVSTWRKAGSSKSAQPAGRTLA